MPGDAETLHHSPEDSGEGRWMSYDELSQARGIGRESAVKLVQAKRWRKMQGNDGSVRVLIPPEWLQRARKRSPESSPEASPESSPELSHAIKAFEAGLAVFREQVEAERQRADRLQIELTVAEGRAGAERQRAERAEAALAAEREAHVRAVVEAAEFWSRGRLARMLAA